ncbi:MAG: methyl-accepting chemotaxis protein [Thermodesulfovibrionales bacterium]|nr:methyl-accepting chemotaxis protein [Thermodesulfovibrionales bacterium]
MKKILDQLLSMSIKGKVIIGYVFTSMLIFSVITLMLYNTYLLQKECKKIGERQALIEKATMLKTHINGIRASFLRLAIDTDETVWENQMVVLDMLMKESKELIETLKNTIYKDKVVIIEQTFFPFKETIINELIPLVKKGKRSEVLQILSTVQNERSKVFISTINEIIKDIQEDNARISMQIEDAFKNMVRNSLLTISIIFIVTFGSSYWFINRFVLKTLSNVSVAAQKVANGDLTTKIDVQIHDDFGRLAEDVNKIIFSIQQTLRDVAHKTFVMLQDITKVTFSGQEVCYKIDKDLERITASATATEEMSATTADISRNIYTLAQASEKAKQSSINGKSVIEQTVESITNVNNQIKTASDEIIKLSELSKKIDDIVILIKDIADQTNLLALNAAIEAARAGEQGRGFAVVADEVRKLAARTTNATVDINNILNAINKGTSDVTSMMSEAVQISRQTTEMTQKLHQTFEEIFESFKQVSEMTNQIVVASEEQAATASEIASNLSAIAGESRENTKNIKDMANSINKFSDNAKSFLKTISIFKDPMVDLGVLKADYVLWLNRLIHTISSTEILLSENELDYHMSRMGKWYYSKGRELYSNNTNFVALEEKNRLFHEIGKQIVSASAKGDRERAKNLFNESLRIQQEIFRLIDALNENR